MRAHVQTALTIVAVLYLVWGIGFVGTPETVHKLLTTGPYSPALSAMLGAAIFALAALFLIGAFKPQRPVVQAAAAALAILGGTAGYQMFAAEMMPRNAQTVASLVIDIVASAYLFMSQLEVVWNVNAGRPRRASPRRKGAPKHRLR